jgi:ABC-2 type transport system permease protein
MPEVLTTTRPRQPATVAARPVRVSRLVLGQIGYANRAFRRNPVMAVVTLAFPLAFLLLLGLASRETGPLPEAGAAAIQSTVQIAAVFASIMAAYVMLPFQLAQARERGVVKRLSGTPLPTAAFVAGQVASAVLVAAIGTTLMLAVAVVAFGLDLPLAALPPLLVGFLAGVTCAAALGIAVASLVRGAEAVMTFTMGSFLLLAFASGTFGVGAELPRLLDVTTWWFPLRHFSSALAEALAPGVGGPGFGWSHIGVLVLWTAVGVAVASWGLQRVPASPRAHTVRGRHPSSQRRAARRGQLDGAAPSFAALATGQLRHANRSLWRQPSSAFFSVAFPVLFTIVVPYAFGNPIIDGVALPWLVTPAMAVFAIVVTAFVNVPESVAIARQEGILKRLRGTPLPASAYLVGRLGSIVWVGAVAVIGVFVAGWAVHGVTVTGDAVLPLVMSFVVGTTVFAALGLAVVALVRDAGAVPAVGLGLFLPLAFISDMLAFGMEMPPVLATMGWIFPLKHLVHAVDAAFAGGALAVGHLGVVVLWGVLGAVVATWRFRWT